MIIVFFPNKIVEEGGADAPLVSPYIREAAERAKTLTEAAYREARARAHRERSDACCGG